jgi:hypothetical protein
LISHRLEDMNLIAQKAHALARRASSSPRWNAARVVIRARRASHTSGATLERELASYATPAEQNELNAILDRADPNAAANIRRLIHRETPADTGRCVMPATPVWQMPALHLPAERAPGPR